MTPGQSTMLDYTICNFYGFFHHVLVASRRSRLVFVYLSQKTLKSSKHNADVAKQTWKSAKNFIMKLVHDLLQRKNFANPSGISLGKKGT